MYITCMNKQMFVTQLRFLYVVQVKVLLCWQRPSTADKNICLYPSDWLHPLAVAQSKHFSASLKFSLQNKTINLRDKCNNKYLATEGHQKLTIHLAITDESAVQIHRNNSLNEAHYDISCEYSPYNLRFICTEGIPETVIRIGY